MRARKRDAGAIEFTVAQASAGRPRADGIELADGTVLLLGDEPPVAVSKGWGERSGGPR